MKQHQTPTEKDSYPNVVCQHCAEAAGGVLQDPEGVTWHTDTCEVCGVKKAVTSPRDFGYPDFKHLSVEDIHGLQGHHP